MKLKKELWVVISYFFVSLIFFFPVFQSKTLIYFDNLLQIAPAFYFWKQEILQGRLPLWNPYILAGLPFLADPSHPVFSPFNLVFLVFDNIFQAISFQVILLVFLASLGTYSLARSLKLSKLSSWLSGLIYGFSGSTILGVNDLNSLVGLVLLPWVLAVFRVEVIRKKKYLSWRLSLVLALQLLSGHTQYAYYALLLMGVWFLIHLLTSHMSLKEVGIKLVRFGITLVLGLGLAAVQILPSAELLIETSRPENINYQSIESLQVSILPRLIFPRIYGTLVEGNSWGPNSSPERGLADIYGFVSLSSLILTLVAIRKANKKDYDVWFLTGVMIISFILAFGNLTPIFKFFYHWVPGFRFFRSPGRILTLYSLAVALLAAIGMEKLRRNKNPFLKKLWPLRIFIYGGTLFSGYLLFFQKQIISNFFIWSYKFINQEILTASTLYSSAKIEAIGLLVIQSGLLFLVALSGTANLIFFTQNKKLRYFFIGVTWVVIELFFSVRGNLIFADLNKLHANQKVVQFLQDNLGSQRFISTGEVQPYTGIWVYFNHLVVRPPFSQEAITDQEIEDWQFLTKELMMLPANVQQFYKLKTAAGYVAVLPKRYRDFVNSQRVNSLDFRNYDNPVLNDFAVKYFVSGIPSDILVNNESGKFIKVFQEEEIVIYENKEAKPRSEFLVNDETLDAEIKIIKDTPSEVVIKIKVDDKGLFVLRDFYYPGWQVTVDNQREKIEPYQQVFCSVILNPGDHQIIFRFLPWSLLGGLICSLLSLGGIIVIARMPKGQ